MKISGKKIALCCILFMVAVLSIVLIYNVIYSSNVKDFPFKDLNTFVEKETFKGDGFSYTVSDGIKVCNIENDRFNICYYTQNERGIYADISECCEEYRLTLTYEEDSIKIRYSAESKQYWCRIDYDLNPIDIDDEIYYNRIINCTTEQKISDINNYFNEHTVSLLNNLK